MKGLFWSLVATLAGVAMLAVGIAGVAGAFDGDDSSKTNSTEDVANFDDCPSDDARFSAFNSYSVSGEGGSATVIISCQESNIEVSMVASSLPTDKPRTIALWLYNKRKDAVLISSAQQEPGDDTVVISGPLPSGSENYKKLVITQEPPSDDLEEPERPTKTILEADL